MDIVGDMLVAKDYIKSFYNSRAWKSCRESYLKSKGYVCERCGGLATMVHHREYISVSNHTDPNILTNFDNLEALCYECHNKEHERFISKSRYKVNADGTISINIPR